KTDVYEKKVPIPGKKDQYNIIQSIKLKEYDNFGNPTGNYIYYTCNPSDNGEHIYVGFMTRSNNPFGLCMPCCFKKDPYSSANRDKRDFFSKCMDQIDESSSKQSMIKPIGERLYVLQDTNKIQEGRIGYLPKYLDIFFNIHLNKTKKIKNHYLLRSVTGY